ncbi:MAG: hypothetical protein LUB61_07550 [Eggerthellaceae bacterium]|nr:hypothetical protein [Eggerthellaceae bacterium]
MTSAEPPEELEAGDVMSIYVGFKAADQTYAGWAIYTVGATWSISPQE